MFLGAAETSPNGKEVAARTESVVSCADSVYNYITSSVKINQEARGAEGTYQHLFKILHSPPPPAASMLKPNVQPSASAYFTASSSFLVSKESCLGRCLCLCSGPSRSKSGLLGRGEGVGVPMMRSRTLSSYLF